MSGISSGVGLISGLPINDLVDKLIATQGRPITLLKNRLSTFSAQRTSLLQVSAQLLSVKNAAAQFALASFFNTSKASTSNESSILASAGGSAAAGDYLLTVRSLAAKHQLISRGFATADQTIVGAGTLTLESSQGQVNRSTRLGSLNGGAGVQAGRIRITDRSGAAATVDLVGALTVNDVVDRINATSGVQVTAQADGDHFVLVDQSGGTGSLGVAEVGAGRTAADLGLLQTTSGGTLTGSRVYFLSDSTRLSELNDGNGVYRRNVANDLEFTLGDGTVVGFNLSDALQQGQPLSLLNGGTGIPDGKIKITNRAGASAEVDLTGATTVQDVINRVNAANIGVSLTLSGSKFVLLDTSLASGQTAVGSLKVENVGDSTTADALGIAGVAASNRIDGKSVYSVNTLGDLLRVINQSPQSRDAATGAALLTAQLSSDGRGLVVTDQRGGGALVVKDSQLARDLGLISPPTGSNPPPTATLQSKALIGGLNTVLLRTLNGGAGVNQVDLQIGDRLGGPLVSVNIANAVTLDDVIKSINSAGTGVHASIASSGLGIELTDTSGGAGSLRVSGFSAASLGISVNAAQSSFHGDNLQRQYLSAATLRTEFNQGAGIPSGKFRITDSVGATAIVDLTGGEKTLGDIIAEINSRGIGVVARINDSGDGLLLEDTANGALKLKVSEEGGSVAKALGILGEAADGAAQIDGSFEKRVSVDGNDTLSDVLEKIRASGAAVNASIINDGSAGQAYRLSLVSSRSGLAGALAIDGGATGLTFDVLSQARDAVVVFGDAAADRPLVISSGTNTLESVISGVRLDLTAVSDQPVAITVRRDEDAILAQARSLVDKFNTVIGTLDSLTRYDSETEERGVLQGDATARRIRQSLTSAALATVNGSSGGFNTLSRVGIRLGSGGKLELDEEKFSAALAGDPEGVKNLFAQETTDAEGTTTVVGLAGVMQREIERLTGAENGIITLQEDALQKSETQVNARITQLTDLLTSKRDRLLAQFQSMESVLANLQSQQSALSALSTLAG